MPYDPNIHHRRSIRLPGHDYAQPGAYFVTICTHKRECVLGDIANGHMQLNGMGEIVARFWLQVPLHFPSVIIDACVTMPNHGHALIITTDAGRGVVATPSATPNPPRDTVDAGWGRETQPLRNPADPGAAIRRGVVATPSAAPNHTPDPRRGAADMGRGGETQPLRTPGDPGAAIRRGVVATPVVATPVVATPVATRHPAGPGEGGETPPLRPPTLGQIVAFYKYQTTKIINQMRDMVGVRFWQRNYWEHVIRNEAEMQRIRDYIHTNPARWSDDQLHPDARANRFNQD
jgi:putative transposase